jgi:hypothetical protein
MVRGNAHATADALNRLVDLATLGQSPATRA